jgi:hypothetical protein
MLRENYKYCWVVTPHTGLPIIFILSQQSHKLRNEIVGSPYWPVQDGW